MCIFLASHFVHILHMIDTTTQTIKCDALSNNLAVNTSLVKLLVSSFVCYCILSLLVSTPGGQSQTKPCSTIDVMCFCVLVELRTTEIISFKCRICCRAVIFNSIIFYSICVILSLYIIIDFFSFCVVFVV